MNWAVLNFFYFYEKISHAPKSTKKYQKHRKAPKAQIKHKNAAKQKHKNAN